MTLGSLTSVFYTIMVMVNFLACFWFWIGNQGLRDTGWLAQEYSARPSYIFVFSAIMRASL